MFWFVLEKSLAVLGFIAAGFATWVLNRYRQDRAMLIRHEELLKSHEEELGLLKQMRVNTNGGSRPQQMITTLQDSIGDLAHDIEGWQRANEKQSARSDKLHDEIVIIRESLARTVEALTWIKEHINNHKR